MLCISEVDGNYLDCIADQCTSCLLKELKNRKWHSRNVTNDYDFLKIAYEKNIIKALPSSIKELSKEDKDRIKTILTLCHLEEYNLC